MVIGLLGLKVGNVLSGLFPLPFPPIFFTCKKSQWVEAAVLF